MHTLSIERNFNMSVEKLFDAFKNPEILKQWFAPGKLECTEVEVDFRVGGAYRIRMDGDDEPHVVVGEYLEIEAPNKIVFSWRWHTRETTTKVSLAFKPTDGNGSKLTLVHSEFSDEEGRDQHNSGWSGCLDKLKQLDQ